MKICSACLVGIPCRYDGKSNIDKATPDLIEEYRSGSIIPLCPEQIGGLTTPRPAAEIQGLSGDDVLEGRCNILTSDGADVTESFVSGAKEILKHAQTISATTYIAVPRSPSCGCGKIYDGSFSKNLKEGDGVTTALMKRNGIRVVLGTEYKSR
ncbi:DUF523 domain-containing protein [Candidatus Woesearchaeota archaeon]|nr:DUF523 domain-containing protein [Candidatus Woesearchaeota archaeon]